MRPLSSLIVSVTSALLLCLVAPAHAAMVSSVAERQSADAGASPRFMSIRERLARAKKTRSEAPLSYEEKWRRAAPDIQAAEDRLRDCARQACGDARLTAIASAAVMLKHAPESLRNHAVLAMVRRLVRYEKEPNGRDVWQDPLTTLRRGRGDCEDYAILAMGLLRLAGVPAERLSLELYFNRRTAVGHATIAIASSKHKVILDPVRAQKPRLKSQKDKIMAQLRAPRVAVSSFSQGRQERGDERNAPSV